jgi:ribosomal protein L7/L12
MAENLGDLLKAALEKSRTPVQTTQGNTTMTLKYVVPSHFTADDRVLEHLRNNEKVSAIKYIREIHGIGLKESKDIVDKMCEDIKANPALLMSKYERLQVVVAELEAEIERMRDHRNTGESLTAALSHMRAAMWDHSPRF